MITPTLRQNRAKGWATRGKSQDQIMLKAQSDCSTGSDDREVDYALVTVDANGRVTGKPREQHYVVQKESDQTRVTGKDQSFGPGTSYSSNNKFEDQMANNGKSNTTSSNQTFYISSMGKPKSAANMTPVPVLDSRGQVYNSLNVKIGGTRIFINDHPVPSLAPCGLTPPK